MFNMNGPTMTENDASKAVLSMALQLQNYELHSRPQTDKE